MKALVRPQFVLLLSAIALCIAPASIALLILAYGVDAPYADQIAVGDFLIRNHGRAFPALDDVFQQHNESRIVLPRLVFFYLARLTGWNVKWEMAASLLFACAIAGMTWLLSRSVLDRPVALAATAAGALLIFSPVQWWNWTVGFQLVLFVPPFLLAAALVLLTRGQVTWAAVAVAVATFSFANGILLWVALLPAVCAIAAERKRFPAVTGAWVVAGVVAGWVYFRGYQTPQGHPPLVLPFEAPGTFAAYCLAFLGHPLTWTRDLNTSILVGGVLVIIFLVCLVAAFRQRRRAAWFWMAFALYAALSAGAAAAGRLRLGLAQALEPRYATFSVYFALAVLLLVFLTASPRVRGLAVAVLVTVHLLAIRSEWPHMKVFHRERLVGRAAVDFALSAADHSALREQVWHDVPAARRTIAGLAAIGYLDPIASDLINRIDIGAPPIFGDFVGLTPIPDGWGAYGWASLPGTRPADAVLLTRVTEAGERIVGVAPFAALMRRRLGAVEPALLRSGWQYSIPAGAAPAGTRLTAWAYDTNQRRAFRLAGSFTVAARTAAQY